MYTMILEYADTLKENRMTKLLLIILCLSLAGIAATQTNDMNYTYDPDDRPDPFVPYKPAVNVVPAGEISVTGSKLVGITESHGKMIALFQAADNKTHFLKIGDRVYDGIVENITRDSVVFKQFMPEGSVVREKEVVRHLYPEQQ
jgi:hypothetical protein